MKLRELLQIIDDVSLEKKTSKPFICGGIPRDKYLKKIDNISDLDITTGDSSVFNLSKSVAIRLQKKYNILYEIAKDNHLSIKFGKLKLDFSSNFIIPNIENHLNDIGISNPNDFQKEMFSRDFTCNSLLMSFDLKKTYDITSKGIDDINHRIIRTCLPPEITLLSYKNRVIRSIYLACKLDFNLDNSIIQYVKQNPSSVKISTKKNILEKLEKAFSTDPDKASNLITKMNLWDYIPILQQMKSYRKF